MNKPFLCRATSEISGIASPQEMQNYGAKGTEVDSDGKQFFWLNEIFDLPGDTITIHLSQTIYRVAGLSRKIAWCPYLDQSSTSFGDDCFIKLSVIGRYRYGHLTIFFD